MTQATTTSLPARVLATDAALGLIKTLVDRHGPVLFHQSGGCCDGSAPMCYHRDGFIIGDVDLLLGWVGGQPFYVAEPLFRYLKGSEITLDVAKGRGGSFSLEAPEGVRFLSRSRLFTDDEFRHLQQAGDPPRGVQH